jgi:hypothetical protein
MAKGHRTGSTKVLWGMLALAIVYYASLNFLGTLTGVHLWDGIIGVVLGLYICSHPSANAVDLLFFRRYDLRQIVSGWSGVGWILLNLLVMLVGWLVIVIGAIQLVEHTIQ